MASRTLLTLLALALLGMPAAAESADGQAPDGGDGGRDGRQPADRSRPPEKGRGAGSHGRRGRTVGLFTTALQSLSRSLGKRSKAGPRPGTMLPPVLPLPTPPAPRPEPPAPTAAEPAPVLNPAQVPNPLADLNPVVAAPAAEEEEEEEEEEDAPTARLSAGAIAVVVGGIAFGLLLLVGLTVMIAHHRRPSPKYRRPRRRDGFVDLTDA